MTHDERQFVPDAIRDEAKARRRMIRALGAAPTTRGAPEEEVEPETEEVA